MNGWHTIDSAPKDDGKLLLVYAPSETRNGENPRWGFHLASWDLIAGDWCDEHTGQNVAAEYWLPLPSSPT